MPEISIQVIKQFSWIGSWKQAFASRIAPIWSLSGNLHSGAPPVLGVHVSSAIITYFCGYAALPIHINWYSTSVCVCVVYTVS